jgi:hypothetical protein
VLDFYPLGWPRQKRLIQPARLFKNRLIEMRAELDDPFLESFEHFVSFRAAQIFNVL